MAKIENIKMWESILKELWHWPQKEALVLCIKNALRDQGLQYNSDTKKIEYIKQELSKLEAGKLYKCTKDYYTAVGEKILSEGKLYHCTAENEVFSEFGYSIWVGDLLCYLRPATEKEILEYTKNIGTEYGFFKKQKEETKQESSDGELSDFESEIAHILVYANNEPTNTDEERKRAYQKYAKNAKFFAPFLLEKAYKQLQPEIDAEIEKAYKNQDEVQYRNGYNKAIDDACEWLKDNFYEDDRNVVTTNYDGIVDFIDNFRKALEKN